MDPSAFAVNEWRLRAFGPFTPSARHVSGRAGAVEVGEGDGLALPVGVGAPSGVPFEHATAAAPSVASDATRTNARRSSKGPGTAEV